MARLTTRSLEGIQKRLVEVSEDSIRHRILTSAKNFKTSWIDLGQALYSVWKDKLYKEWGYITFDAYSAKEIGIKNTTAMKLLKSYYFLEKEEPVYLEKNKSEERPPAEVPSYESVNMLRLAKNKKDIGEDDYENLKKDVLEDARDVSEVRKSLAGLLRQRAQDDPEEARKKRRAAAIRRLLGSLKALRTELEASKMVSAAVIKETSGLIARIEKEIS